MRWVRGFGRALGRRTALGLAGAGTAAALVVHGQQRPVVHAAWGLGGPRAGGAQEAHAGVAALAPHLTNTSRRFKHYADSLSELTGQPLMSPEGFLRSVLGADKDEPVDKGAVDILQKHFSQWEKQNDGRLCADSYAAITLLLNTSRLDLSRIFSLFDSNESSTLTCDQLGAMLNCLASTRDKSVQVKMSGGLGEFLFGQSKSKEVSLESFEKFVGTLRRDVWSASFKHVSKGQSRVDPARFMTLALASAGVVGVAATNRIERGLKQYSSGKEAELKIASSYPYEAWVAFHIVVQHAKQLTRAMELSRKRFPLTPAGWYNVTRAVGLNIPREHSDLIYLCLDKQGERKLDYGEVANALALFGRVEGRSA